MSNTPRLIISAMAALVLGFAASACGASAIGSTTSLALGTAITKASSGGGSNATVSGLQSDIQQVETAPTAGQLASATNQLAHDLASAASVGVPGGSANEANWNEALNALQQAVQALQQIAAQKMPPSSPSPLQQPNPPTSVKDVIEDLNSGYDLLEKVVKDIVAIGDTYTLKIVNLNLSDGEVTANNGIKCGRGQTKCAASEPSNVPITVSFMGAWIGNTQYIVNTVDPNPPGCFPPTHVSSTACSLTADTTTTITVSWVASSTP